MARYIRLTLAFCGVTLIACVGYLAWSFTYGVEAEPLPFSSSAWKEAANVYAHSPDPGCVRGGMALDIIASKVLQNMSTAEVKSLLGEPDGIRKGQLHYELGQCSGFGWHNSILRVGFLENQTVAEVAILRHDR